jgi:hypothetical protein
MTLCKRMWKIYESTVAELFLAQFEESAQRDVSEALDRAALSALQSPG